MGFVSILLIIFFFTGFGFILENFFLKKNIFGLSIEVIIVSFLLCQKSLFDHVMDIYISLYKDDIQKSRIKVSKIVSRNTYFLNKKDICSATIESLSENISDGIIAPSCFFLLFGLSGIFFYKILNTADSMIGYKNKKYQSFGFFTAKLDDIANYFPSRFTGYLIIFTTYLHTQQFSLQKKRRIMVKDAKKHRSPNSGWPESAFAVSLDICLGGLRDYGKEKYKGELMNASGKIVKEIDILRSLKLFQEIMNIFLILIIVIYIFFLLY